MPKIKGSRSRKKVVPYVCRFKPPTRDQQLDAVGFKPTEAIPRAFIADKTFFKPIPKCTSIDDWLAQYREPGQTYERYVANSWLPSCQERIQHHQASIYILPVGNFDDAITPPLEALIEFTQTFYNIPVKKLSGVEFDQVGEDLYWCQECGKDHGELMLTEQLKTRYHESGHIQLQVGSCLRKIKTIVPEDAVCVLALCSYDLYSDDTDLFVAGMAAGNYSVAIFTLFRYDPNLSFCPEFWHSFSRHQKYKQEERSRLILLRSCRLLVHEIAHLLGVGHCICYACCMNGSGHLEEDFRQPMFLCPVDLRKLQTLCGFDIVDRYQKMAAFFKKHNMKEEGKWVTKRCELITKEWSV